MQWGYGIQRHIEAISMICRKSLESTTKPSPSSPGGTGYNSASFSFNSLNQSLNFSCFKRIWMMDLNLNCTQAPSGRRKQWWILLPHQSHCQVRSTYMKLVNLLIAFCTPWLMYWLSSLKPTLRASPHSFAYFDRYIYSWLVAFLPNIWSIADTFLRTRQESTLSPHLVTLLFPTFIVQTKF